MEEAEDTTNVPSYDSSRAASIPSGASNASSGAPNLPNVSLAGASKVSLGDREIPSKGPTSHKIQSLTSIGMKHPMVVIPDNEWNSIRRPPERNSVKGAFFS